MTTKTCQPPAECGTMAAYSRGCRCLPCRAAKATYNSVLHAEYTAGKTRLVDTAPVRKHMEALIASGVSQREIAARAGVTERTISRIHLGYHDRMKRTTAEAICAITEPLHVGGTRVPSIGTTRRLQALVAAGNTVAVIAKTVGVVSRHIYDLLNGECPQTNRSTAEAVARAYNELWHPQTKDQRALKLAASRGWAPPMAWDDEDLDDPSAGPHMPRGGRRHATRENIRFLTEVGETRDQIVHRLGIQADSVARHGLRARRSSAEKRTA